MIAILNRKLVFCFLLMLPFTAVGVMLGGYILSPGVVIAMLLCVTLVFYMRSVPACFIFFLLMMSIFVITALGRHPPHTYIFSIFALLVVAVPVLLIRLDQQLVVAAVRGHALGLVLTLSLIWLEIVSRLIGVSPVIALLEQVFPYRREAMPFLGYQRPSAGFQEPAHLAMYLVFSLVFIDALSGWSKTRLHSYLKVGVIISALAVGSVSGMLLLVTYYVILFLGLSKRLIIKGRLSKNYLVMFFFMLIIVFPVFLYSFETIVDAFGSLLVRLQRAVDFLLSLQFHRSEGSRINAIPVMIIAWVSEGPLFFLFGTGYANSEEYLIAKYGGIEFSSFAEGNIANIYAVIGISAGFLGLSAYLLFLRGLYVGKVAEASFGLKLMFLLLHFFTGDFISFYFWAFIFMMVVASASCRVNAYALCENGNSRSVI